jgi:hypothetical protein
MIWEIDSLVLVVRDEHKCSRHAWLLTRCDSCSVRGEGDEKKTVLVVRLRATTNQKSITLEKLRIERWSMLQVGENTPKR